MIDCPRHGVLLHGTQCVGCDCGRSRFATGGFVSASAEAPRIFPDDRRWVRPERVSGFDPGNPGGDKTAYVRFTVDPPYSFTVDDIELHDVDPRITERLAEQMRRHRERMDEAIFNDLFRNQWRHPEAKWGAPPRQNAVEIITDPADRRGFDARPVGVPR